MQANPIKVFYARIFPWRVAAGAEDFPNPLEAFRQWRVGHSDSDARVFEEISASDVREFSDYLQEKGWSQSLVPCLERIACFIERPQDSPDTLTPQAIRGFFRALVKGIYEDEIRGLQNFPQGWIYQLPRNKDCEPHEFALLKKQRMSTEITPETIAPDFRLAVAHGDIETVLRLNLILSEESLELRSAARNGHTETFLYARYMGTSSGLTDAAANGQLHILPYILAEDEADLDFHDSLTHALEQAIKHRHTDCAEALIRHAGVDNYLYYAMEYAPRYANLSILQHLHQLVREGFPDIHALEPIANEMTYVIERISADAPELKPTMLSELLDYYLEYKISIKVPGWENLLKIADNFLKLKYVLDHAAALEYAPSSDEAKVILGSLYERMDRAIKRNDIEELGVILNYTQACSPRNFEEDVRTAFRSAVAAPDGGVKVRAYLSAHFSEALTADQTDVDYRTNLAALRERAAGYKRLPERDE